MHGARHGLAENGPARADDVKLRVPRPIHLAYCLNVHPGETWADQLQAIRTHAAGVRARVSRGAPFGLGLRLNRRAASDLAEPGACEAFRDEMRASGQYAFTVNAFPYGVFHGRQVKEQVYAPDWRAAERLEYTLAVAGILAECMPDDTYGSISTVPGTYRCWAKSESDRLTIARNLAACAWHLAALCRRTGREIVLALEPEPDCLLETTEDVRAFFQSNAMRQASDETAAQSHAGADEVAGAVRRHLGVCLDTCHLALQFESPIESVRTLAGAGIRIAKVQLSAALRAPLTADALARLRAFVEPVYLHQTRIRDAAGAMRRWPDLTEELLAELRPQSDAELRCHFHVPLHFREAGDLRSTRGDITALFVAEAARAGCSHFEIETYTFHVLPDPLRAADVVESLCREYEDVLEMLAETEPNIHVAAAIP